MTTRNMLIILCCASIQSVALGVPAYTGGEPWFWDDRCCLLARVEAVVNTDRLLWRLALRPLASLRGDAELLKKVSIEVEAIIDPGSALRRNSAITEAPEPNSYVVVVISRYKDFDKLRIERGYVGFMPDKCGIASVKGDPLEFLQKLRKAILEAPPTKEKEPPPGNPPYPPR